MENNKLFDILQDKNISPASLKLYFNNLKRLNDNIFPKSATFLGNVELILKKIEHYKANTRRTYLISIVTLLKHLPKQKKLYDKYYALLDEYNKSLQTNNVKSDTQKQNWITQDEVNSIYNKLSEEVTPLLEKKKLSQSEYDTILSWVVLSLYTLQPPRRNLDYQQCVLINKYLPDMDKKYNYLDKSNNTFIFNNYKTKGTYKSQEQKIPDELVEVIDKYLKVHPLKNELKKKTFAIPFLVDHQGNPFQNINSITRILNKIFGKRIGVSMLRNIYLTSKYSGAVKDLDEDAKRMGTSVHTAQSHYVKLDGGNIEMTIEPIEDETPPLV
jgi:hypothetical protein